MDVKFIQRFSLTAFIIFFTIIIVNWRVDPYNYFGNNELGVYFSSRRMAKGTMIRQFPHDAIITGSSRIAFSDTSSVSSHTFFNAGFPLPSISYMSNFLADFVSDEKLIVIALDMYMFHGGAAAKDMGKPTQLPAPKHNNKQGALYYLVSWNIFKASIETVYLYLTDNPGNLFLFPDGRKNMQSTFERHNSSPQYDGKSIQAALRVLDLANYNFDPDKMDLFENLLDLLNSKGIRTIVFF